MVLRTRAAREGAGEFELGDGKERRTYSPREALTHKDALKHKGNQGESV